MFVRNILRGVYVREGYDGGEDEFLDPVVAVKLSYLINL